MQRPGERPPLGERITIDAAIGATGLSRSSIFARIGDGRISVVKEGRRTLVITASLAPLLPKTERRA